MLCELTRMAVFTVQILAISANRYRGFLGFANFGGRPGFHGNPRETLNAHRQLPPRRAATGQELVVGGEVNPDFHRGFALVEPLAPLPVFELT